MYKEINKTRYNDTIMPKMWEILKEIFSKTNFDEHQVLMLSLYGSQNYRIENENSDIDCECFIFPTKKNIIFGESLYSTCITTEYGTCHVKDIRAAFNELRKSSPNILEIFASPYMIINEEYNAIIEEICFDVDYLAHLSPYKLMRGLDGLYNKYRKEMMISNKAYANMLRIENMMTSVLHGKDYTLELVPHNYIALRDLKYQENIDEQLREKTENGYSAILRNNVNRFYETTNPEQNKYVLKTINDLEEKLMTKYIKLEF